MFIKDRITLSTSRTYTDEGFLIVPARIGRSGIQEYRAFELGLKDRDPSDVVRVYRPEEEVFAPDSLASFTNKPVTDDHPPVSVDATNARQYGIGHSGPEVKRQGIFAATTLFITHADSIKRIESGKIEISNGYTADLEVAGGVTPHGESYDAVQRNIKGNHIALVDNGRCGPACSISDSSSLKEHSMKVTINGIDYEMDTAPAQAVGQLQTQLRDTEAAAKVKEDEAEELKKKADEAEAELKKKEDEELKKKEDEEKEGGETKDTLRAKLDDALTKVPTPQALDALVDNRIATRDAATTLIKDYKWAGKDCEAIRKDVVATLCKDVNIETVSVDYIRARFDGLAGSAGVSQLDAAISQTVKTKPGEHQDSENIVTDARDKFAARSRDAWKPKSQQA